MINIPSENSCPELQCKRCPGIIHNESVYRTGHGIDSIIWYRQGYDMKEK